MGWASVLVPVVTWGWVRALRVAPGSESTALRTASALRIASFAVRAGRARMVRDVRSEAAVSFPSRWLAIRDQVEALLFVPETASDAWLHPELGRLVVVEAALERPPLPPRVWSIADDVRKGRVRAADVQFDLRA